MDSFIKIGNIDISKIRKKIIDYDDWENRYTETRNQRYVIHKDTSVIPILYSGDMLNSAPSIISPKTEYYDRYYDSEFFSKLDDILLKFYSGGYAVRIVLALLYRGGEIGLHTDDAKSLVTNKRIHIPIITNNNVFFEIDGIRRNIKEGEIVEINNQGKHGVFNQSEFDRVHLIVDWFK